MFPLPPQGSEGSFLFRITAVLKAFIYKQTLHVQGTEIKVFNG